ncbi:hypothetical protein [Paenibacillus sp. FSL H8-0283]|uniref:hypothetical protein n=1 Tax=Paenibacillus sp. FSL H8-0283 TaxID=2921383 RepID=UPI0032463EF4
MSVLVQQKEVANVALSQLADSRHLRHSKKMMSWIEEHFKYEIRLDQIGVDVHQSKSYASRIFHQEIDSNIKNYIKARRLKQAFYSLT